METDGAAISAWIVSVYLAGEWVIRLAMIPVVTRKRSPNAALAWLAVVFFWPWAGLFVYLLMGETHLGRFRAKRHTEALARVLAIEPTASYAEAERSAPVPPAQRDLERLARELGGMGAVGGNAVTAMTETEEVIDALVADIDAAKTHAHLEFYIFAWDETGRRVGDALTRAAARGVRCRLLVDDVGSRPFVLRSGRTLTEGGVQVRPMLPARLGRAMLSRVDLRNHRKLAVIDGRIGYAGSQNVVNADYGEKRVGPWMDMTARMEGPAAHQLQRVFLEDWLGETGELLEEDGLFPDIEAPHPAPAGAVTVQTAPSGPGPRQGAFRDLITAALGEAQERVILTTPYFVPDEPMLSALRITALRGAKVDLVVPSNGNHPVVSACARGYFGELLDAGVRVHLHRRGLLHAKSISVDDAFALVGSGNFDMRSFHINYELTQLFYGGAAAAALRAAQEVYLADADLLTREALDGRSLARRTLDDIARLASPLL